MRQQSKGPRFEGPSTFASSSSFDESVFAADRVRPGHQPRGLPCKTNSSTATPQPACPHPMRPSRCHPSRAAGLTHRSIADPQARSPECDRARIHVHAQADGSASRGGEGHGGRIGRADSDTRRVAEGLAGQVSEGREAEDDYMLGRAPVAAHLGALDKVYERLGKGNRDAIAEVDVAISSPGISSSSNHASWRCSTGSSVPICPTPRVISSPSRP